MRKIFVVFVLFVSLILQAETDFPLKEIKEDFNHFAVVGYNLLITPVRFERDDWVRLGIYSAITAGLSFMDKDVKKLALKNYNKVNDIIFSADKYHGKNYTLFLSLSIYGSGYLFENHKIRKVGLHATEAFFYSGVIVTMLKSIFGRERPYLQYDNLSFKPFELSNDHYFSFPSGHATISFAVSTALAKSFENIYWKSFWYGSAVMVSASRVYHDRHWISDVFAGGVLGYSIGAYIVNFDKDKNKRILFTASYNKIGLIYKFM